jgi:hypothetical protein
MAGNADSMTERMAQASRTGEYREGTLVSPKKGERFRCSNCGMEIEVTQDCRCQGDGCARFECCGQEMDRE